MQTRFSKQRGITLMGLIFVLFVLAVFGYAALLLMPFYQENINIERAIGQLQETDTAKTMPPGQIKNEMLNKYLFHNDVRGIKADNFDDHFTIERIAEGRIIKMHYFREAKFFYNVYLKTNFEKEFTL